MKYKIGEIVTLREELEYFEEYYNEEGTRGDELTPNMARFFQGLEGRMIVGYRDGGYIFEENGLFVYYDEMLEYPKDYFAECEYVYNREVEDVINLTTRQHCLKLLDEALDNRLFKNNPEEFQKLIDLTKEYTIEHN